MTTEQAQNTDKEIWRRVPGDFYSPSIHVTQGGGIGINVGGLVFVAPVEKWHEAMRLMKEDKWLPIETAPKDGSTYLVANDKGQVAPRIRDIVHNNVGTVHDFSGRATCWAPLPPAPSSPPSKSEGEK